MTDYIQTTIKPVVVSILKHVTEQFENSNDKITITSVTTSKKGIDVGLSFCGEKMEISVGYKLLPDALKARCDAE